MIESRKRAARFPLGVTAVAILVVELFSFVPACWMVPGHGFVRAEWVNALYTPVLDGYFFFGFQMLPRPGE